MPNDRRKFTGPRRSRDDVSDVDEQDGIEDEEVARDGNQENLSGNRIWYSNIPATSLAEGSPPFVLLCISKRASSAANSVCVISSPPNVSELQMRAVRRNTSTGSGGSIETGREFRSASSRIYLKTVDCGETENVGIGIRERNRRDNGVNRNRKKNLRPTLLWKFQRKTYNFSRILDVGSLTLGNKRHFSCFCLRAKVTSQTS